MNDAAVSDPNLPRSADALQPAETKLLPNVSHNAGFGMTISAVGTLETCRLYCAMSAFRGNSAGRGLRQTIRTGLTADCTLRLFNVSNCRRAAESRAIDGLHGLSSEITPLPLRLGSRAYIVCSAANLKSPDFR